MVLDFYAASYGAGGFINMFGDAFSPLRFRRLYIIKGGPGTGKSTFMKRIGSRAEREGMNVEYYYCSSDPSSLDGVIVSDLECAVIDGTAPHTTDPKYPAAADSILNFGAFIDIEKAERERENIVRLSGEISGLYSSVKRYLGAAERLYSERMSTVMRYLSADKMQKYAEKPRGKNRDAAYPYGTKGVGGIRYLSSSAPGRGLLLDKIYANYDAYAVKSRYGIAGKFIETAADIAEKSGNTVIRCPFPAYGDGLEAALICDLGVAYISSDESENATAVINADRFLKGVSEVNVYAKLCKKVEGQIVSMADGAFAEISRLHRELEKIYGRCTDFESLTEYTIAAEDMIFRAGHGAKNGG